MLPGIADNAIIGASYAAEYRKDTRSVASLRAYADFTVSGGALTVGDTSFVDGILRHSSGVLNNVGTLNTGSLACKGTVTSLGGSGTTTISGPSTIGDGVNFARPTIDTQTGNLLGNTSFQSAHLY